MMNGVIELLKSPNGIILAAASFVLGSLVTCIVCKLFRPCGKGRCAGGEKSVARHSGEPRFDKPHPAPADGSIEIYVGNLSYDLTEDQLRKEFEAFGKVNSARIITHKVSGKSKGFGFVHMQDRAEAEAAVKALSEKDLLGRRLKCNMAKNVY